MKKSLTIFILLLIVSAQLSIAQTFPVQVNTQILPPYSVYLADYVAPGTDRMLVNVLLRDIARPQLRVKLQIRIEGQGVTLKTKPTYLPPALILQGGVPEQLMSTDLASYFNPDNLDFTGITKRQFLQTGALPEGVYRFTIEVLEYNRSVKISNSGTTVAWLILNDPPIINIPYQAEKVRAQYPQNVVFQWTPRHTGSPNSAFNTEYEFRMVEIWPEGRNPNDAMRTTNTLFELTTQSTSLIYGIAEPALVPGRSYAFQIRAKSIVGIDELDLFKNNGYSQVHSFTFGDACLAPTQVAVEEVSSTRVKLSWKGTFNHTAYTVSYRQANDSNAEWFQEETFFTDHTISSLEPDTEYEYQVLSACGTLPGEYTATASITTEGLPIVDLQCGLPPEGYSFDNNTPLASLLVGDRVFAGDFDVKVTKVEGSNGAFSGDGVMVLPLMNNVKVKVKFRNITVNNEYRMIAGDMEVIGAALDLLPDEVVAMIDDLNETLDDIEDALDDAEDVLDDIDNVIGIVTDVIDEIGGYLPDDIVQEITAAQAEIKTAKAAMSNATTDTAKEEAKAEIKTAKGKLKGGVKKAIDHYAKTIKDILKVIKEILKDSGNELKESVKNLTDRKPDEEKAFEEAQAGVLSDRESANIGGDTQGKAGSIHALQMGNQHEVLSDEEVNELAKDPKFKKYMDKLVAIAELTAKLEAYGKIAISVERLISDKKALTKFFNDFKESFLEDDEIKAAIKERRIDNTFKEKLVDKVEGALFQSYQESK